MAIPIERDVSLTNHGNTMKMPRALIWYEGRGGAGYRIVERIRVQLAQKYHAENIALRVHIDDPFISYARSCGTRVYEYSGKTGREAPAHVVAAFPKRLLEFRKCLDDFKPDIVILAMNFALSWPLCHLFKARNIRFIYIAHDPEPHSGDYMPQGQIVTQKLLMKYADHLITPSNYTKTRVNDLKLYNKTKNITVIPLHSFGQPKRMTARAALDTTKPLRFLFLGRLISYKGLDALALAAKQLMHRNDWSLTIAGNGPIAEQVKQEFSSTPQVDLSYIAWLSEAQVDGLIETHDVLICPYSDATQSGVIMEAMYDGMPAIVTSVGGLPEQVDNGNCGWISDDTGSFAIAKAMIQAIDERDQYRQLSAKVINLWRKTSGNVSIADIVASEYAIKIGR